jgi:octaprenyl-diphosphate synthase
MQLLNIREPDITEQAYMDVIRAKTAMLFEAAARLGAIVAGAKPAAEQAIADYGSHLGTAFQLVDDLLDYTADDAELGKNTGDDLAEGKPTLPLIIAMRDGDEKGRALIRTCIADEGAQINMPDVLDAVRRSGAIDKTLQAARGQVQLAIDSLSAMPQGIYRDALVSIAESSVDRRS